MIWNSMPMLGVLGIIWKDYITQNVNTNSNKRMNTMVLCDEEWAVVPFADSMTWMRRKIVLGTMLLVRSLDW